MKPQFLLIILLLSTGLLRGQDPNLYNTWYLHSYEYDLGDFFPIASIDPPISPTLIIEPDLTYYGNAACNGYDGNFSYDPVLDVLNIDSFSQTLLGCNYASHTQFELDYFGFFTSGPLFYYRVDPGLLELEFAPGFILTYSTEPLTTGDVRINDISVYPNPVNYELFISSEIDAIEHTRVYSVHGQILTSQAGNTSSVDVSSLSEGIYFVEITTELGRVVKKFIKK